MSTPIEDGKSTKCTPPAAVGIQDKMSTSREQRSEHDNDKNSDAPCDEIDGSILPEEYTVLLLAKVKKLLAMWANEVCIIGHIIYVLKFCLSILFLYYLHRNK